MTRIAILYSEYTPIIDVLKYHLNSFQVDCFTNPNAATNYDLVILTDNKIPYSGEAVICHHSLLPAFNSDNPIKDAFLAGVKVTGITIYYKNSGKIIAQYPMLIKNESHFDEITQEIKYLAQTILPITIEKILKNEIIDLQVLLKNTGGCSGCKGGGCSSCKH